MALGAYLKQRGARCRVLVGHADVHLVFMHSVAALVRSADKGGGMLGFSWWRPVFFGIAPVVLDVVIPAWALASGGASGTSSTATLRVLKAVGGSQLAAATATHLVLSRHFDGPLRGALLWPLGEAFMGALTLRAGLLAWKDQGVFWRRTFYPRAVLEAGKKLDMISMRVSPP